MTSPKAIQIAKELDIARSKGDWQAIPELARRYKKYNPDGTVFLDYLMPVKVLEQTSVAEATLSQFANEVQNTTVFRQDSPDNLSMTKRLSMDTLKHVQLMLKSVVQIPDTSEKIGCHKEFAKIVLARSYFECGDFQKTLDIVEQLSFNTDDVTISLEMTGNIDMALHSHRGVVDLLSRAINYHDRVLVDWAEEALYRGALLSMREDSTLSVANTLDILRTYQKLTSSQAISWRIHKRMVVARYSLKYLSNTYRRGEYTLTSDAAGVETNGYTESSAEWQMFVTEITQLHAIYEKMLYALAPFPRAGQSNDLVLDFVDQLASDFELIGYTGQEYRGFIEKLDRAAQRTFNSPRITRYLFLGLFQLGEYDEAKHALHSYLYLVGLTSQEWEEKRGDGEALATDVDGNSLALPAAAENHIEDEGSHEKEDSSMASKRSSEKEPVEEILRVLLQAIKMYSSELPSGVRAVEIAEMAREMLKGLSRSDIQEKRRAELTANVYRAVGAAYSLLASQTCDPIVRPKYHERALTFLTRSIEMEPNAWETYYQLALQQADMRDVGQALQSITRALQANPSHLPSWHLLTLVCSCPAQNDIRQALKTCEMGLQEIGELADQQLNYGRYKHFISEEESEQQILLQITQAMLLDAIHGPEAALQSQEALFASYGRLAVPDSSISATNTVESTHEAAKNGLIVSGSLGNLSEHQLAEQRRRGRSASSSAMGNERADQTPISASRSHDNVHNTPSSSMLADKAARSLVSVNGNGTMNERPGSSTLSPEKTEAAPKQHHGLHLFSSRSSSRRAKKEPVETTALSEGDLPSVTNPDLRVASYVGASMASFQSATPSLTSTRSIFQPTTSTSTRSTARVRLRRQRFQRIMSDLWLLSAASFLKLGKLDEALKAIEEAENVEWTTSARVWCMLGRLRLTEKNTEQAIAAFQKGLVAEPNDVECRVWLAKIHKENSELEIAEGLLDHVTKGNGWDCAEAWFHLGDIYRQTGRLERTKDCLSYALDLENTRPIQPFSILPRYV
ncbi:hypothetical protein EC973_008556 [Apophysomyces ossiformis]|uniref:TPR-like protein n=1 Tax=Apophysomyces ossiformis TaxID=679940 RepID=A0A8H7EQ92_9FUNG|nr:hypothetical protein EC973_008556 [Apophysomyces ossiformis]